MKENQNKSKTEKGLCLLNPKQTLYNILFYQNKKFINLNDFIICFWKGAILLFLYQKYLMKD